jgi:trigger factor
MKVETEELPNSEVALSFEIEDARVERALDAAAKRLSQRVNIPGFRRGKAPRALIERTIGKESLLEEALDQLLPEVYREALQESQIRALTQPEFDVESTAPLKAKATIIVPPPVELGDYQSVKKSYPEASVEASEVDAQLEQLRERYADWTPADQAAAIGDRVMMRVVGEAEGREVVRDQEVDFLLEADVPIPVPGFSEAVAGIQAGETREFELAVPEDHEHSELAGKTITFHVEAKEVRAKELPALDDAFAAMVGDHASLEDLRSSIESQLRQRSEATAREETQKAILDEVIEQAQIDLPEKLIEYETQRARERFARNMGSYGLSFDQYNRLLGRTETDALAALRATAEADLRREFVLQAIARTEGIEVTEEEVDAGITEAVMAEGGDQRAATRMLQEPSVRAGIRSSLLEQRAARWLMKNATGVDPDQEQEEEAAPATAEGND